MYARLCLCLCFEQVRRLLTRVRRSDGKGTTVQDRLNRYSFVRTWADRSETVVGLRSWVIAVFKLVKSALQFVYALLVQPFWWMLDDRFDIQHAACVLSLRKLVSLPSNESNADIDRIDLKMTEELPKAASRTFVAVPNPVDSIPEFGSLRRRRLHVRPLRHYCERYLTSMK